MPQRFAWALPLAVAAALMACQPQRSTAPVADGSTAPQTGDRSDSPAAGDSDERAPVQTAHRPDSDAARDANAPADAGAADDERSEPDPTPGRINANPQRVLGADGRGLRARLGEPTRRRAEAEARIWQYHASQCVLDVVLYPENGAIRAAHIEARDRKGRAVPSRRCLRAVLEQRRAEGSAQR